VKRITALRSRRAAARDQRGVVGVVVVDAVDEGDLDDQERPP
jgi:hypothetical protein